MKDVLNIWTVYKKGLEIFPDEHICRRYEITEGQTGPTNDILHSADLEEIRSQLRRWGLYQMPRDMDDDPVIIESWI
ncbi:MAG: hypothetical protein WKF87_22570 [Chryseolinea sp.]